jgi:hypothetical protein
MADFRQLRLKAAAKETGLDQESAEDGLGGGTRCSGERIGRFGFCQYCWDFQSRDDKRWSHIAIDTWSLRHRSGRRSGRRDLATGVICGYFLNGSRRRMPTDHRAMGPAMFGRCHVQPARGYRRQRRPQQNHYQRRGNELEPPRHILLNHTTGAVPA